MSTLLAFAIDADTYMVFGCGDGFYIVNGELVSLEDSSGAYLAGRLAGADDWRARLTAGDRGIQLHASGATSSLDSLVVGTDGFEELPILFHSQFAAFLRPPRNLQCNPGFWPAMAADYRSRFWQADDIADWASTQDAHDDRTFLVIRRVGSDEKEAALQCSALQEETSTNVEDSCQR